MDKNLKEIRPGHFVKIKGNQAESVSKEESDYLKMLQQGSDVDAGVIQVALGLAAVLAIFTTISTITSIRVMANIGFLISTLSAVGLYASYCEKHVPRTMEGFYRSPLKKYAPLVFFWFIFYFFVGGIRYLFNWKQSWLDAREDIIELSYIALFIAMVIGGLAVEFFVLIG